MRKGMFAVLVWLGLTMAALAGPSKHVGIDMVRVHNGHDPLWASPAFDDQAWPEVPWYTLRFFRENLWIRFWVDLPEGMDEVPVVFSVGGLFSAELYWDGVLLGQKGVPGEDSELEKPGPIDSVFFLPGKFLSPGRHLVALRLSSHHQQQRLHSPFQSLAIGAFQDYHQPLVGHYLPAFATLSALLLASLYFAGRFWGNRTRRSLVWLSAMCGVVALQLMAETLRGFLAYPYPFHMWRIWMVLLCTLTTGYLLLGYLGTCLDLPRWRRTWSLSLVVTLASWFIIPGYDGKTKISWVLLLTAGLFLAFCGFWKKHKDGGLVLVAVVCWALGLVVSKTLFLDRDLYLGFLAFVVVVMLVEIRAIHHLNQAHKEAVNVRQRLELELLRKQIQPHFLMNTLTSLAEWFETSPTKAAAMLEAIADVYRLLLEVADQTIIPLQKEIHLCEAYLQVMAYRSDRRYHLRVEGALPNDTVPPAVFLTLLENALTHNAFRDEEVVFHLRLSGQVSRREWQFLAPLANKDLKNGESNPGPAGTGTSYIQARMREAYGERWSFQQAMDPFGNWAATGSVSGKQP